MQLFDVGCHAGEVFREDGELRAALCSLGKQPIRPGQIAGDIGTRFHLDDGGRGFDRRHHGGVGSVALAGVSVLGAA